MGGGALPVMLGYHGQPDATSAVMAGEWYRTGDLARQAPSGHLTITGRLKDIIIRAGENILPAKWMRYCSICPGCWTRQSSGSRTPCSAKCRLRPSCRNLPASNHTG